MSSANRINANRRNARRSSGPRTPAGKAVTRLNSLTHGAFAKELLLPDEDAPTFRRLVSSFRKHYRPETPTEEFLVSRMILASWRLTRLAGMESRILRAHESALDTEASYNLLTGTFLAYKLREHLHRGQPKDETEPDTEPDPEPDPEPRRPQADRIAKAWLRDTDKGSTVTKLVRYQNALERSYYRAQRELQRLRANQTS